MKKIAIVVHEISPVLGSECRSGYQFVFNIIEEINHSNRDIEIDVYMPPDNIFNTSSYYADVASVFAKYRLRCNLIPVAHHAKILFLRSWLRSRQQRYGGNGNFIVYNFLYYLWLLRVRLQIVKRNQDYDVIHFVNHINSFILLDFFSLNFFLV